MALLSPHIAVSPQEEQDYTVSLELRFPEDSKGLQELRETYQRSTLSLQEAKKRYDDIQTHYQHVRDKNKLLKDQIRVLQTQLAEQQTTLNSTQSQLRVCTTKAEILEEESSRKDQEIVQLKVSLNSLQHSDETRFELESSLKQTKLAVSSYQKELQFAKKQLEEAHALSKKREEQIRILIKRVKTLEGETAYWKEEARKKSYRVGDLERKMKEQKSSPEVESRKQESVEKRLQKALKQLDEKRTELELLKSMVKRVSPQRKQVEVSPLLQPKVYLSPPVLPQVKHSMSPVPAAKPWPRDRLHPVPSKSILSPIRPALMEQPRYYEIYSPPLEAIHKNIMNYTPSELRLPPVEDEETKSKSGSERSGSDLAREDLA